MKFIDQAKDNYNIAIKDLVYNPGVSPLELVNLDTIKKLNQFTILYLANTLMYISFQIIKKATVSGDLIILIEIFSWCLLLYKLT